MLNPWQCLRKWLLRAFVKFKERKRIHAGRVLSEFFKETSALSNFKLVMKQFTCRVKRTQKYWGTYNIMTNARLKLLALK